VALARFPCSRQASDNDNVTTPAVRIWAELGGQDDEPGLEAYLPAVARDPATLAATAARVAAGDDLRGSVADFLDDLRFARWPDDVARRIAAEPEHVGPHVDAYLAAIAEHTAVHVGIDTPAWSRDPGRFLDHFWWPSKVVGLRARTIVESPAAFRRRGIFIGATTLQRV
jgi:hypothetical protein